MISELTIIYNFIAKHESSLKNLLKLVNKKNMINKSNTKMTMREQAKMNEYILKKKDEIAKSM